jgi:trigger factor
MSDQTASEVFKIEVHEEPAWRRVIDVEVAAGEVNEAFSRAFTSLGKKAKFPGFRPGKAPREVVRRRLAPEAEREVLQNLIAESLEAAYRTYKLVPISDPHISSVHLKEGEAMRYRVEVDIRPTVPAEHYNGLVLQKKKHPVSVEDVEGTLLRVRERRAEFVAVERAATRGDVALCDLQEITPDRLHNERQNLTDVVLELNPERVFPEFADGLLGLKAGDRKQISLGYPDDYANSKLAGRRVDYEVKVKQVRERRLPELNEEFLKTLAGDITSTDDLRARVRADLEAQVEADAVRELNSEIVDQVLAKNPFDLPRSLVEDYLQRLLEDLKKSNPAVTYDEVSARYKEMGSRQVRWQFLYHAIADKEKVDVTEAEVDEWLAGYAEAQRLSAEEARKRARDTGQISRIRDNMLENKVLTLLRERSTITELAVSENVIVAPGEGLKR